MRSRTFRPAATILSLLLMAAVPVHAGPLTFADVVHVMGNMQNGGQNPQLRLRTIQQQGSTPTAGQGTKTSQTPSSGGNASGNGQTPSTTTTTTAEPSSLIQGSQTPTTAPQTPQVEVAVDQGDIEGTVCDCGEVRVPTGGFPLWWLAGIPAVCLTGICHGDHKPQCIPGPNQNANCETITENVPEPASLLLFGSGLAALAGGARRRYRRVKLEKQQSVVTEV